MMERHKCKLCLRSFSNGRALGGHMRSHMMNLPLPPPPPPPPSPPQHAQFSEAEAEAESGSFSSEEEEKGILSYGLRENPKKSIRVVDPEFSFAASGSVVLQDRESETESSKNPTRRRSKRARKSSAIDHHYNLLKRFREKEKQESMKKKVNHDSWTEPHEPVSSSISDTTTEEDVAFCLMMLSRDKWTNQRLEFEDEEEEEEEEENYDDDDDDEEEEETDDSEEMKFIKNTSTRGNNNNNNNNNNYKCETCNKVFRSYQALGGHRASHKKIKVSVSVSVSNSMGEQVLERKRHECPVCLRVFSSGQALGGHKRSHVTGGASSTIPVKTLIDLNLPAPFEEDDDFSQIEVSAVSDADFVNAIITH